MSTKTFDSQIDKIVLNVEDGMLGAVKNAIRKTVQEAQTPLAKGGKMHVDTGFLRWSGTASLNSIPVGEEQGRTRKPGEVGVLAEYSKADGQMLNEALLGLKIGDVFYFGWTAKYAEIRETYDGFMISAANNFYKYLDEETRRLK